MITKILFTAAIIVAVMILVRIVASRKAAVRDKKVIDITPGQEDAEVQGGPRTGPILMGMLALVVIAGVAYLVFSEVADGHREITVEVINTRTGESTRYQVEKGDIRGRTFRTLDGRTVTVADVERIEILDH